MEVGSSSLPGTTSVIIVNYQFSIINSPFGGLAQLARAPALQAGGQRFESVILHLSGADIVINDYALCIMYWKKIFDMLTQANCK